MYHFLYKLASLKEKQVESLDIYLPLLVSSGSSHYTITTAVLTSIAQLLANTVRTHAHRRAVAEWLPSAERQKEVKTVRGWKKTATLNGNGATPWVAKELVCLLEDEERMKDRKVRPSLI